MGLQPVDPIIESASSASSESTSAGNPLGAAILSLRNVTARFGGLTALGGVSLDIAPGEVAAVVGPNGAGKSTLLNAVSGLIRANVTGQIELAGEQIMGRSPVRVARAGVGRSFQDPPLVDSETVLENVLLGEYVRTRYGLAAQIFRRRHVDRLERAATERACDVLDFMGIGGLRDQKVGSLAYGTRKLIDIGRAIAVDPRLLLLDEPTSGLDHDEQDAVGRLVVELHRTSPVTILIVEHHMDVVRTVADRVFGLQSGTVLASGTPDEVLDSTAFRAAILGVASPVGEPDAVDAARVAEGD